MGDDGGGDFSGGGFGSSGDQGSGDYGNYSDDRDARDNYGPTYNNEDVRNYEDNKNSESLDRIDSEDTTNHHHTALWNMNTLMEEENNTGKYDTEIFESKPNQNGEGVMSLMLDEGSGYGQDEADGNKGCSGEDCCYYTVACCDCTIL